MGGGGGAGDISRRVGTNSLLAAAVVRAGGCWCRAGCAGVARIDEEECCSNRAEEGEGTMEEGDPTTRLRLIF
jgi:hypothetical protein